MAQKIAGGKTRSLPGSEPRVTCHHELAEEVLADEHDELITKPRKRRKMDSSTPDPLPEDLITLDDEPSETQLMSVSKEVGGKWKAVLVNLEIKKNKIDSILQTAFGIVEDACFEGLVFWRNGNASQPVTWKTLFQSLRKAGLKEETEELRKMFNIPLDAAEDMEQEGLTEHGVTMQKVSSRCNKHLRERYRNQKVEDTWLNAGNPVHIRPTFLGAKTNIRNEEDTPNVSDVAKGTGKETYYFPIEITDVLTFNVDRKDRKVVLIEGAPGSGKSTTARYLCRLWEEDKFGQEYMLFIMIQLRMLKNEDCGDIKDLVMLAFCESLREAAEKEILAHSSKVLFLFEGWDERPENCAIVHKIVDGQELPASSIIITSRYNSAGELYKKIDRGIELAVFSYSNRVEYIKKYFDSEEKSDSLITLLTNHPDLKSLCSYPMMLSMICYTHLTGDFKALCTTHRNDDCQALFTATGVYDIFICLVVNQYFSEKLGLTKSGVKRASDILKESHLSGFRQCTLLALEGVQKQMFVFNEKDLKELGLDLTGDCERSGIVLKYTRFDKVGKEVTSYQFLHDSVQCFFAALEMSQCKAEKQLEIVKKYIDSESLFAVSEHFTEGDEYLGQLDNHRYKQQYSEELELDSVQKYEPILSDPQSLMLQFFAGNTGLKNPEIASTLIEESRKGSHDQWCKSALPLILYESQNKELTKNIMREVLKPQIVVSCQDDFHLRCTAWCMAQAERKVEELTIILPKHIRLKYFFGTCDDLSSLQTLCVCGSVCTSEILLIIKVMQQNMNVLKTLKFSISIEERDEKSETLVESELEEMSRLICCLPALHELSIGSGSSKLTDRLTQKVLQQAVSQTWKGKVLRVESSSPATLKQAFASSQKLSSAKSPVILDSLYLIHRPSGNADVQGLGEKSCASKVLKESQLKLLAIGSFPSACFSYHLMQDVATAAVQRKYKEPMMIVYDTVTPGSEEAKNIIHICVHDQTTATAFHIYVAHVDHLHCFESLEFSFIRLGKKWSSYGASCWMSCHGSELRGVVCSEDCKKHLPDLLRLVKRRGISKVSLCASTEHKDVLRNCIVEFPGAMTNGENQNFEAHKFLTFSQKKPLGDHHCWNPAKGKLVECPLHEKLRKSVPEMMDHCVQVTVVTQTEADLHSIKPGETDEDITSNSKERSPSIHHQIHSVLYSEEVLNRKCWIPFGVRTLPVDPQGCLCQLCDDGTSFCGQKSVSESGYIEIPQNAFVAENQDVHCALIIHGPFLPPSGYQFASPIVYISFDTTHNRKPITLHLPHWYGGEIEDQTVDDLTFVMAPHSLKDGEATYQFEPFPGGEFLNHEGYLPITGHNSLFAIAFKDRGKSSYYATSLVKEEEKGHIRNDVVITYAHPVWKEIFRKYCPEWCIKKTQPFSFGKDKILRVLEFPKSGPGWTADVHGTKQVKESRVSYSKSGIFDEAKLETVVIDGDYPPRISWEVLYGAISVGYSSPEFVCLEIAGTDEGNMNFLCKIPIVNMSCETSNGMSKGSLANGMDSHCVQNDIGSPQTVSPHNLEQGDLNENPLSSSVDSDESFHTPTSPSPTEQQAVNGHFTESSNTECVKTENIPAPNELSSQEPSSMEANIPDIASLMPYMDDFLPHLIVLGGVLKIEKYTKGVVNASGGVKDKCCDILTEWLQRTPNPTWRLLCEKLEKAKEFNGVRRDIIEANRQ